MTNYANLAASNGSGEPIRAVVQAPRSIGSSTLTVNLTTNWPTGTFIATTGTLLSNGTLNPTTVQVFYGTASGATITIVSYASGYTDLGNSIGDVVVIKPTTEWANLASQGVQSTTQFPAQFANFVEPAGGVWTQSSGLIGQATAGNVWYNGTRSAMPLITSKTFTASKDTYVDFNPSSSAFTYVPVTNFAQEPAVTASCVRIAKVITGASAITLIIQSGYQTPRSALTSSNPYKFSYTGTVTTLGASATAIVVSTTKNFDTSLNVSAGIFTAPIAGFYKFIFTGILGASNGAVNNGSFFAYKNGSVARTIGAWLSPAVTGSLGGAYPFFLQLAAGDTVQPYGLATTGGNSFSQAIFEGEFRSTT